MKSLRSDFVTSFVYLVKILFSKQITDFAGTVCETRCDIVRAARPVPFEDRSSSGKGRARKVVKRERDYRAQATQRNQATIKGAKAASADTSENGT